VLTKKNNSASGKSLKRKFSNTLWATGGCGETFTVKIKISWDLMNNLKALTLL